MHIEYDSVSYKTFQELAKEPESGVRIRQAVDYFDHNPTGYDRPPWWSKVVQEVRNLDLCQYIHRGEQRKKALTNLTIPH